MATVDAAGKVTAMSHSTLVGETKREIAQNLKLLFLPECFLLYYTIILSDLTRAVRKTAHSTIPPLLSYWDMDSNVVTCKTLTRIS